MSKEQPTNDNPWARVKLRKTGINPDLAREQRNTENLIANQEYKDPTEILYKAANESFNTNRVDVDDNDNDNDTSYENPASETSAPTASNPLIEASSKFEQWKNNSASWDKSFLETIEGIYSPEIKYLNWRYPRITINPNSSNRGDKFHVLDIFKIDSQPTGKTGERYIKTFGTFIKGDDSNRIATVKYHTGNDSNRKALYTTVQMPYDLIWRDPTIRDPQFFKSKLAYNPNKTYSGGRKTKRRKTRGRKTRGRKTKGRKTRKPKRRRTTRRRR